MFVSLLFVVEVADTGAVVDTGGARDGTGLLQDMIGPKHFDHLTKELMILFIITRVGSELHGHVLDGEHA